MAKNAKAIRPLGGANAKSSDAQFKPARGKGAREAKLYELPKSKDSDLSALAALRVRPPLPEEFVDTRTLALYFKMSRSFFEKLRVSGGGPPFITVNKSSQVRYRFADVQRWADNHATRRSTSEPRPPRAA